jgi:chromosomal replication initiator protein
MPTLAAFARLIALPENRSAFAAIEDLLHALTVSSAPKANLLFLHGPTGTGKTALVQALSEEWSRNAEATSCVLAAAEFPRPPVKEAEDDADENKTARQRLMEARRSDVLVVEDLQHLPAGASEALVQLIDRRSRRQLPMIFTAATGPSQLCHRGTRLPARLTNRLAGGLVIAMEPWQAPSRLLFLRESVRRRSLKIPEATLAWLAQTLSGSGRQLDGALRQLDALQRLLQKPLSPEQLRMHFHDGAAEQLTVERIAEHVGGYFRVEPRQIKSARRSRDLLMPRQISMYLARRLTVLSLQQIGTFFGGRDHSTVLHACRKVEQALESDAALSGAVRRLSAELG